MAHFSPYAAGDLPTFRSIVQAKYRFAKTRWRERASAAFFQKYPDRRFAVMGWTGQAEAPGYALQVLAEGLRDEAAIPMALRSLDFLSQAEFYAGGFHTWYNIDAGRWQREELVSQGQAMLAFARAIEVGRKQRRDTRKWEQFLERAARLHASRILSPAWRPASTSEAAFIAPLIRSSVLLKLREVRQAAQKAAQHYADRHLSMREPYWGGTLDASCEDKEAAALAFQGFLELYEVTKAEQHLEWARHACDVMLTYTYVWDVDLPPGRLRDHRLRTRGWTGVSVQNQHLDVWGTFTAPDVYRLGQIDGRTELQRLALVMYRTCGQLIDSEGSQGEQMQQTNYVQRDRVEPLTQLRGGYNEAWTVFWVTAHFLTGAARFQELGVPIWE